MILYLDPLIFIKSGGQSSSYLDCPHSNLKPPKH